MEGQVYDGRMSVQWKDKCITYMDKQILYKGKRNEYILYTKEYILYIQQTILNIIFDTQIGTEVRVNFNYQGTMQFNMVTTNGKV